MKRIGYHAYQKIDIFTANPKKLIILCYEGAIHSLKVARLTYQSRQYETKGKAIQNVLDIIGELREALDFERGGEIANGLDALYSFMTRCILKADRTKDAQSLDHVVAMLEALKSAWEEISYSHPENRSLSSRDLELTPLKDSRTAQYQEV